MNRVTKREIKDLVESVGSDVTRLYMAYAFIYEGRLSVGTSYKGSGINEIIYNETYDSIVDFTQTIKEIGLEEDIQSATEHIVSDINEMVDEFNSGADQVDSTSPEDQVKDNLLWLEATESKFEEKVIEAFGDYGYKGEYQIMVDNTRVKTNLEGYGQCEIWNAYINHEDAPTIKFVVHTMADDSNDERAFQIVEVF
jgi:hypothetical protein